MDDPARHWHVTVTVAGDAMEPLIVRNALRRLSHQRPFMNSMKYAAGRAEVQYWEEGETLLDASSLALRLWNEYRDSAGLPRWEVVGLEVLEQSVVASRPMEYSDTVELQDVTPLPF